MIKKLPDNLALRRATPADSGPLAEFNSRVHSDDGWDEPEAGLAVWTRDLYERPHPTFTPDLTTVVVNEAGQIVSTALLFPQTWSYDGIPFGVGRPELVATHPDYRRRGLIRLQMEVLHDWSAALGHRMEAIGGIPYYYRQFGYEMGLDMGGGRVAYPTSVPKLKDGEAEPFRFRPAGVGDIPVIMEAYENQCRLERMACVRDAEMWTYELTGRTPGNLVRQQVRVIETAAGEPAGYIAHNESLHGGRFGMSFAGLRPGRSWSEIAPSLLRYMLATGDAYAQRDGGACEQLSFMLGPNHPIFALLPSALPTLRRPYAWYIRIADLPGFIGHVAPALENRLAASAMAGYTGETEINFYRSGLKMAFNAGKLTTAEAWRPDPEHEGQVRFPDLTFISLLCGRKSFTELREFFPDCFAINDTQAALMEALFPKQGSNVYGVV